MAARIPFRWPSGWNDPAALKRLRGTPFNCILMDGSDELDELRARAVQMGFTVVHPDAPGPGIAIVKGVWPGIQMSRGGGQAEAGPTGNPWVNSNGWLIQLTRALQPGAEVWVDAPPPAGAVVTAEAYRLAVADSAAYGGCWIATELTPAVVEAARFFAERPAYPEVAICGVVSDFTDANEFFSRELLNLLARAGMHYHVLAKGRPLDTTGLRALIYADSELLTPPLLEQVAAFVDAGGLLITGNWRILTKPVTLPSPIDRFSVFAAGKGKIALCNAPPEDPYVFANDSVVLVSHRYDLVRFWNAGPCASFVTREPGGRRGVAHLLFYADRGPDTASVRLAGRYRSAHAAAIGNPHLDAKVKLEPDAIEIHLPAVSQYVALELEAL